MLLTAAFRPIWRLGPSEEIDEERRLLYVAMTRAKNDLDLIVPQRFFTHQQSRTGDRHVYASASRFIPATIYSAFDRRAWREGSDRGQTLATTTWPGR